MEALLHMKTSIYIVDDELMAIKYFKYLIQMAEIDCEIVGEATNGVKAIPDIIRLKPDIVFADISMPVMDGLQMAEAVLKKNPSQTILLLTSYRDFDFVKKGMKIGVSDYILKNELSEESLKHIIQKVTQDISIKKKEQHMIMEHNIRDFLLSDSAKMEDHIYESRPMQRYALVSVIKKPEIIMKHINRPELPRVDCYQIKNLAYPQGIICRTFAEIAAGEYCGVFFIHEKTSDHGLLFRRSAELILEAFEAMDRDYVCIISEPTSHFLKLQEIYKDVKRCSDYLYVYQDQQIFWESEVKKRIKNEQPTEQHLEVFIQMLEEKNKQMAINQLQVIYAESKQFKDFWKYSEEMQNIFRYLKEYVQKNKLDPEILEIKGVYTDTKKLEETFTHCLDKIFTELDLRKEHQYSRYILLANEYIQKNYEKNISIPDIADAVKVSEGHLRRCFKQELNIKLVDYLTEYRLERAKILMENGEGSIDNIWQMTGFASGQYFSYVFKKKEGMAPRDYLKKIGSR